MANTRHTYHLHSKEIEEIIRNNGLPEEISTETQLWDLIIKKATYSSPKLLFPLIYEIYGKKYPEDSSVVPLSTEYSVERSDTKEISTIKADLTFCVNESDIYHFECEITYNGLITIRMFEYDISIALEHASFAEHAVWEIEFPQSCVLYIRNHRSLPDFHEAIVKFADGQKVRYRIPIIQAKKYTVDRIFEKRLLILLPYHILRYEHFLKHNGTNSKKVKHLLDDFREINRKLEETSEKEQKSHLYMDMIVLIEEIADYIIPEDNEIRKGLGEIMGGKILKLRSEELLEQGEARGEARGRIDAIQNMIDLGLTREQILRKYSPEEYEEAINSMSVKA